MKVPRSSNYGELERCVRRLGRNTQELERLVSLAYLGELIGELIDGQTAFVHLSRSERRYLVRVKPDDQPMRSADADELIDALEDILGKPMPRKKCRRCGTPKPRLDFSKNRSEKDGLSHYCKKCERQRVHAYEQRQRRR